MIKRIAGLKKLDLIYQIVDFIASRPDEEHQNYAKQAKPNKSVNKNLKKKS